jgi:hypothetical protein
MPSAAAAHEDHGRAMTSPASSRRGLGSPLCGLALAASAAVLLVPELAAAQDQRLGFEAHAGILFGSVPGLSEGWAAGLVVGGGAVVGPVKLGGDGFLAIASGYEEGAHSATFGGILATVGLAAPKYDVVPILDLHVGGMQFEHGLVEAGHSETTTDFDLVIGSTLGLSVPVSENVAMYLAAKGLLPLFPLSKLPEAGALGGEDGPSRRVFPIFAEVGIHAL